MTLLLDQILADGWQLLPGNKDMFAVFISPGHEVIRLVYNPLSDRVEGAYIALPNRHIPVITKYQKQEVKK